MGFEQKLKDLLGLQETHLEAFAAELDQPWPGMGSDIDLAPRIVVEYQRQGGPLRLIEDFEIDGTTGEVRVLMPEWQTRIIVEFTSRFDEAEARYRFRCCGGEEGFGPLRATSAPSSCRSIGPSGLSRRKASSGSMPDAYNLLKCARSSSERARGAVRQRLSRQAGPRSDGTIYVGVPVGNAR